MTFSFYFEAFLLCFSLCFLVIYLMRPLAVKYGLVDNPNHRKKHVGSIPLIGGISIFIAVSLTSILYFEIQKDIIVYLSSTLLLLLLGIFDDKHDLSVRLRMFIQISVGALMVFGAGIHLTSFGFILGFEVNLGFLGPLVTIVAVIAAINAFNMVDGIDGLAGMLSCITFLFLSYLFFQANNVWLLIPILFIASIIAFLMFNLRWPTKKLNKVFMGDAGSMIIGFSVIWLLVVGTESESQSFRPVVALYFIAIPLMDMAAIMYRRIRKGTSPFKPDREHLHHIFERAGYSRKRSLIIISCMAFIIALLGVFFETMQVKESIMFAVFLSVFFIYNYALMHVWKLLSWIRRYKAS